MANKYKWEDPHDWLCDKLNAAPADELLSFARTLASILDSDQIQDAFETAMARDGYFEPEAKDDANR